ncbi:HIT family protein [Glutamicibacter halophytocola]|uniref:HIT family protein n=1 Tax=Glutamicibacter halophytocola TaxID=1933880 RepID=UPI00321ACA2A
MLHRSHQPAEYQCPFCELVQDLPFSQDNLCAPTDLIYQTGLVAAIMACDGFGNYGGHAMIIPTRHLEALYDLDDATGAAIMKETKRVALAMKLAWDPEGTSTRQRQ